MSGFTHERNPKVTNEDWLTPPEIFEALGMKFDLDPCGHTESYVPATTSFYKTTNGLASTWTGSVFMNPPYGKETAVWIERFTEHSNGIALVFARTDTQWFQKFCGDVDRICFISGRVKFLTPERKQVGTPGSPSMLLAYGYESVRAISKSELGVLR